MATEGLILYLGEYTFIKILPLSSTLRGPIERFIGIYIISYKAFNYSSLRRSIMLY